jgi:hypothetical protein
MDPATQAEAAPGPADALRHLLTAIEAAYFGGSIVTFILFCTRTIDRAVAQRFAPLANLFKGATVGLAGSTAVFSADRGARRSAGVLDLGDGAVAELGRADQRVGGVGA